MVRIEILVALDWQAGSVVDGSLVGQRTTARTEWRALPG